MPSREGTRYPFGGFASYRCQAPLLPPLEDPKFVDTIPNINSVEALIRYVHWKLPYGLIDYSAYPRVLL